MSVKTGHLRVGDDRLWYADTGGDGPAVVLLHAYAGSGHSFVRQLAALRRHGYRAVTYSRRGHPGSTGPAAGAPPAADDLHALVDAVGLGAVHLVGTAAGGFVATDYAQNWPDDVRSLTLACTMIGIEDADYHELCERHRPPDFERLTAEDRELSRSYRATRPVGVVRWRRNTPSTRLPLPPHRRPITWESIDGLTMPVSLITGAEDPYFPPPVMSAVAARVRDGRTAVIPGTGHSAYWEQAAHFNRILLGFLDDVERR